MRPRTRSIATAAAIVAAVALVPATALGLRIVTYNILNFPGSTGAARVDDFRIALEEVEPDVLVVQEILSTTGVNMFLDDVLNELFPGEYAAGPFVNGPDTDNALFYRIDAVDFVSTQQIPTALRDISEYVLRPDGYGAGADFRVYSLHFKAGSSSSDKTKRLAEATILRNHMNAQPSGSNLIVTGDFNIRGSSESAYQKLVGSESDNDGRVKDPINRPGYWHDSAAFADIHTQSPRTTQFGGGATGGMDDRFDQILITYCATDGQGFDYIPGSHVAYGNDGLHLNTAINSGTNYAVGETIADALHEAADHLPVYADFQVPAKVGVPASLDFGELIVDAVVAEPLLVTNAAVAPADELTYALAAPSGFNAPGGSFEADPGSSGQHDIGIDASSPGERSGTLLVNSDDVDTPAAPICLTGTVLAHSVPSLAGDRQALADTFDFGAHPVGEFSPGVVSVANLGYDALQARLEVYDASITGGDDRFGFDPTFAASLVAGEPAPYTLVFDDAAAQEDSVYTALLTFETRDESSLPGWIPRDDLTVVLRAQVEPGTGVPEDGGLGFSLSLASANPFTEDVRMSLALPEETEVRAFVYDIAGRRVGDISPGRLPAGRHALSWDGRSDGRGRAASGVYFVRVSAGERESALKVVLLR